MFWALRHLAGSIFYIFIFISSLFFAPASEARNFLWFWICDLLILYNYSQMAFGFPASYSEIRSFSFQPYGLSWVIKYTLEDLGWEYEVLSNNEFSASVSINLASWGELVNVSILSNGSVEVESRCSYPLQCFDWGKNEENVQTFFERIETVKNWQISSAAFENFPSAFHEKGFSPVEGVFIETYIEWYFIYVF